MILTVVIITSSILGIALVAGMLIVFQIRSSGDFANTNKAIFAADAGTEWWLYNYYKNPNILSSTIPFSNGASFEVFEQSPNQARIVGMAGKSKRAFFVEAFQATGAGCSTDIVLAIDTSNNVSGAEGISFKNSLESFASSSIHTNFDFAFGINYIGDDPEILLPETDNNDLPIYSPTSTLGDSSIQYSILGAINNLPFNEFKPNGFPLRGGLRDVEAILNLSRPSSSKVVVLITKDHNISNGTWNQVESEAQNIKSSGGVIYVVGVDFQAPPSVTKNNLVNRIATSPGYYFDATDFIDLESVLNQDVLYGPNGIISLCSP